MSGSLCCDLMCERSVNAEALVGFYRDIRCHQGNVSSPGRTMPDLILYVPQQQGFIVCVLDRPACSPDLSPSLWRTEDW